MLMCEIQSCKFQAAGAAQGRRVVHRVTKEICLVKVIFRDREVGVEHLVPN